MAKLLLNSNGKALMSESGKVYKAPSSLEIPPVTNIQLSDSGVLTWEFDSTSLAEYNPTITYIINSNGAELTTTAKSYNLNGYLKEGSNEISIIVRAKLEHNGNVNKDNYQYSLPAQYCQVLNITSLEKLSGAAVEVKNDKIYIFGGYVSSSYFKTIQKLDIANNSVEKLNAKLVYGVDGIISCTVDNNIYLFGGYGSGYTRNTIQKFDTLTETITTLEATMPYNGYNLGCTKVGSNIYIFGNNNSNLARKIQKFDILTETFTVLETEIPSTISTTIGQKVIEFGTDIYIFGSGTYNIYKFDTLTETFTTLETTIPNKSDIAYSQQAITKIGNVAYLLGGDKYGTAKNTICEFDSVSQTFTKLDLTLPYSIKSIKAVCIGNDIYLFGISGNAIITNDIIKVVLN